MNSPLLQGSGRRRRRGWRFRGRPPRPRRVWPVAVLAVLVVLAAGAAAWIVAGRPGRHTPIEAAALRQGGSVHQASTPRRRGLAPFVSIPARNVLPVRFGKPPRAGLLFDLASGHALWSLNAREQMPIASLTKIMTAIIVVERTHPGELAPVTKEALAYQGQALGLLPPHKSVPVEGLLAGMLLTSANDAAITLADHLGGTDAGFAQIMNAKAQRLGLGCSRFVSAYGLEDGNVSCAADLGALARIAMHKPRIAELARQEQARVPFPISGGFLYVTSTNPLMRAGYPGTIGLKTGSTDHAGLCFVGVVRRHGRTLVAVLLNSPNPADQAQKLFDAALRGG